MDLVERFVREQAVPSRLNYHLSFHCSLSYYLNQYYLTSSHLISFKLRPVHLCFTTFSTKDYPAWNQHPSIDRIIAQSNSIPLYISRIVTPFIESVKIDQD